jgi:DNA-binding GntR family transcriptional regulator
VRTAPLVPTPPDQSVALGVRTYKAAIYETLTRMIGELEFPPGSRLVEADLAARFHTSKTPIREALLLLESDGLVRLEPYQGATVTWMSIDEFEELIYIQDALEQPALPRIVERISSRELADLARIVRRLERHRVNHDSRAYLEDGAALHERMFAVAGFPRMVHVVMSLILHPTRRYERVFMHQFDEIWDVELAITKGRFDFVRAGDAAGAAACVRDGRVAMLGLIRGRLDDPTVAPYLAPPAEVSPHRATRNRLRDAVGTAGANGTNGANGRHGAAS